MRHTVVIERTPNNYAAYVPDLPGCIATAKTREAHPHPALRATLSHWERVWLPDRRTEAMRSNKIRATLSHWERVVPEHGRTTGS